MVVAFAYAQKHRDHLRGILEHLPQELDIALAAGFHDLQRAERWHPERIVLAQHGAGQSYTQHWPAYPGGDRNDAVGLFLCPNEHSAQRWRDRYPRAAVEVVGSPRLDDLPRGRPRAGREPVVAISFHFDGRFCPEARSSFGNFLSALPELASRYRLLGHAHPSNNGPWRFYRRLGIQEERSFDEICRQADVYICDNSSTLFEFAATGRPVVVLNDPRYRRDVSHGLRFWDAAAVGVQVGHPEGLCSAVARALELRPADVARREDALDQVYAYRSGAGPRAARAIQEWAAWAAS